MRGGDADLRGNGRADVGPLLDGLILVKDSLFSCNNTSSRHGESFLCSLLDVACVCCVFRSVPLMSLSEQRNGTELTAHLHVRI